MSSSVNTRNKHYQGEPETSFMLGIKIQGFLYGLALLLKVSWVSMVQETLFMSYNMDLSKQTNSDYQLKT